MDFHVDIGPQYEGETVRKDDLYVEFGGPKVAHKFELVTLKNPDEIEHEKVEVVGPDVSDMEEGGSYPIAVMVEAAGEGGNYPNFDELTLEIPQASIEAAQFLVDLVLEIEPVMENAL